MDSDLDGMRYRREALQDEVDYRRARRSAIFTWSSSLLVAITSGVVILQVQGDQPISTAQKAVLSLATLILGGYASLWWDDHRRQGAWARAEVKKLDRQLGIPSEERRSVRSDLVGGLLAIVLLTVTALIAIWLPLNETVS